MTKKTQTDATTKAEANYQAEQTRLEDIRRRLTAAESTLRTARETSRATNAAAQVTQAATAVLSDVAVEPVAGRDTLERDLAVLRRAVELQEARTLDAQRAWARSLYFQRHAEHVDLVSDVAIAVENLLAAITAEESFHDEFARLNAASIVRPINWKQMPRLREVLLGQGPAVAKFRRDQAARFGI